MKNAIWLFTVCAALVFWGCSPNPSPSDNAEETLVDHLSPDSLQELADSLVENSELAEDGVGEESSEEGKALAEADTPSKPAPQPKKNSSKPKTESAPSKEEKYEPAPPPPPRPATKPRPEPVAQPVIHEEIPPPPPPKPKPGKPQPSPPSKPSKPDHSAWDKLLRANVSGSGNVNYKAMKGQKSTLEAYLKHLEEVAPNRSWSSQEEMAYWINLYNAWTVKVIVDNYPVSSITKIDGGKTWDVKRVKSGSSTYTLSEVENKILRPKFNDARIHFAINCAAKSCPPLLNRAWTASNLESNLERMTKQFINDSSFNQITAKKAQLSKIFEWYKVDFGNLIDYVNKYSNTQIKSSAKIEYLEYDWGLNGY